MFYYYWYYYYYYYYYYKIIPSVVQITRVKSKAKSKSNTGTVRSRPRPQGLCGRKCPEWQLRCIVESPLTGVGIGRRSRACHAVIRVMRLPIVSCVTYQCRRRLWLPWFLPQLE